MLEHPVARNIHDRAAVAQGAELIGRCEASAGVRRLVAEGAVELGRVSDRLMDGEPQVGRIDHQVVGPSLDARRLHVFGQQPGQLIDLTIEIPARADQELPTASNRWGQRAHGEERSGCLVDMHRGELGLQPDALLHCRRARGIGVKLVLPDVHEVRVDMIDAIRGQQSIRQLGQPANTLVLRHIERIDVIG